MKVVLTEEQKFTLRAALANRYDTLEMYILQTPSQVVVNHYRKKQEQVTDLSLLLECNKDCDIIITDHFQN